MNAAISTVPPKVKSTLKKRLLETGKCSDSQAVKRLLTDVRMEIVYRTLNQRTIPKLFFVDRDDQVLWFLSHAVSLAIPLKLNSPLFTLREISRATARKQAVMEWHPVAPGSREPALTIYLAHLASVSHEAFGSALYGTVAAVASVVLDRQQEDVTEKQVRSALRIINPPKNKAAKIRLYRFPSRD